ncbi:hypothetical protein LSM04_002044 [Trypanosoma melophagium]|uniref:uncharacterized protein n=1 Tax=Trypanosoma melophagium TaxID=715481 RepID=UPI003519EED4|nr:hypothetical protein LSM04_002044 [Trypanosoma melophagium]
MDNQGVVREETNFHTGNNNTIKGNKTPISSTQETETSYLNGSVIDSNSWSKYLRESSTIFCELERERIAGWNSKALDDWYQQRQQTQNKGSGNHSNVTNAPTTSFAGTDVAKLCDRYCTHASRILTSAAPEYFTSHPTIRRKQQQEQGVKQIQKDEEETPPTFLDLGSAPGGVSKFLVTQLHWSGVGVSLPESRGGIAFEKSWLPLSSSESSYKFIEGSITEDDWQRAIKGKKFFFVNGGAVQDHGQRESERSDKNNSESNNNENISSSPSPLDLPPWFNFLVPQLRIAVEHVEDGGVIMVVFGVPQCASLFIMLELMQPLVRGDIHIVNTMHLTKSPVYVILTDVRMAAGGADRAAWELLLRRMSEGAGDFWRGATHDGLRLAVRGFGRHRGGVEAVWAKTTAFLRRRRVCAERGVASATTVVSGDCAVKRQRE